MNERRKLTDFKQCVLSKVFYMYHFKNKKKK